MWIVIIIALVLLLKSLMSSNRAAAISTKTVYVSQACGSSGDCFYTGRTIAAGVSEPCHNLLACDAQRPCFASVPTIHCCHIVTRFPVTPPPIKIQTPVFAGPLPSPARRISIAPTGLEPSIPFTRYLGLSACQCIPQYSCTEQYSRNRMRV